jgi:hypothetical protein
MKNCSTCPEATQQTIYAPTISLAESAGSQIVLNNRSPNVMEVMPTFYTEGGEAVIGDAVRLQPTEIRFVEVKKLIPARYRRQTAWGGMSLSYTGKVLEVWAQIALLGGGGGGSTDVTFAVLDGRGSDVQEAVWWMPEGGSAVLALGNSSATPLRTTAQFADGETQEVDIAPFATRYLRRAAGEGDAPDAVRLTTVGPPGSLRAVGVVASAGLGFANSIRFYDTRGAVQEHLFATNLRLKNAVPHMVLRNTTDAPVTAQPRFRPADGEAGGVVELPALTLAPHQAIEVDLAPLMLAAGGRTDLDSVSVQVANTGAPGSLIGALSVLRADAAGAYDVPLRDSGRNRNLTGSYPWRIDKDYTTVVTITNVGDQPANFHVDVRYPGGSYYLAPRELAVGESASFDLREMQSAQRPDHKGNRFSKAVSGGQFHWSVAPTRGNPKLIGRAEVVSTEEAVSSSYSCPVCCPDQGPFGGYSPNGGTLYIDGFLARGNDGEYTDCYNYVTYSGSFNMHTQYTDDISVATNNPSSGTGTTLYGVGVGFTYLVGIWGLQYYDNDGMDCYQRYYDAADYQPVEPVCAIPTNFRQVGSGTDVGGGTLRFQYAWDSSSNNLTHLSQCEVGEIVDYPGPGPRFTWPSPPFGQHDGSSDPTVNNVPGNDGGLIDNHRLDSPTWVKPYQASSFTATQHYRFRCPCHNNNNYVNLMGPLSIVRSVTQNTNGTWRFTVTKSGASATINPLP